MDLAWTLPDDHDTGADGRAIIKIDDVVIIHADAAMADRLAHGYFLGDLGYRNPNEAAGLGRCASQP